MIFYKVRRKSDGQIYPFDRESTRQMDMFYRQWSSARDLYNGIGWDGDLDKRLAAWRSRRMSWHKTEEEFKGWMLAMPTYPQIELVKYGPGGEIVVWSGSKCELTKKEADKLEPVGKEPLPDNKKNAGIRDEIGPLLDKIEEAKRGLGSKQIDFDLLFTEIDFKSSKLKAAVEELEAQADALRAGIEKIYVQ